MKHYCGGQEFESSSRKRKGHSQSLKRFVFCYGIIWDQQVGPGFSSVRFLVRGGVPAPNHSGFRFGQNILFFHLIRSLGFAEIFVGFRFDHEVRLIDFVATVVNLKIFPPKLYPF